MTDDDTDTTSTTDDPSVSTTDGGDDPEPEPTTRTVEEVRSGTARASSPGEWDDPPPVGEGRSLEDQAELVAMVGLAILAAVAVAGLYTSTSAAVDRLVATKYEPLFQAAFNLVVLLAAAVGLSLLWRRRASPGE